MFYVRTLGSNVSRLGRKLRDFFSSSHFGGEEKGFGNVKDCTSSCSVPHKKDKSGMNLTNPMTYVNTLFEMKRTAKRAHRADPSAIGHRHNSKQTTNTSTLTPNFPMKKCISISFFVLNVALQQINVCAFSTPSSRQDFMKQLATGVASVALVPQIANAAVLRSDKCAYGEGGGCDSLAGDNELIKELQRRSSEKKEATQMVC